MPQFESTFFLAQIFWLLLCFGTLWTAMHFWIVPRLTALQEKRRKFLEGKIEEAKVYQQRAEALIQENQEHLEKARQDAVALIHEALHASQNSIQEVFYELQNAHHDRMEALKSELCQKQDQVIEKLRKEIPDLVELCLGLGAGAEIANNVPESQRPPL